MPGTQGKNYNMYEGTTDGFKNGRNKQTDVDWDALRDEWVTTNITLGGLSTKYGISYTSVRNHYYRDNWTQLLAEFNGMVEDAINNAKRKKAETIAHRILELDEMVLTTSERVLEVVAEQIDKAVEKSEERITAKEIISIMKQASETLKNAQYNIRLSGDKATNIVDNRGISTPLTKEEELRIAEEMGLIHGSNKSKQEESIPEE